MKNSQYTYIQSMLMLILFNQTKLETFSIGLLIIGIIFMCQSMYFTLKDE